MRTILLDTHAAIWFFNGSPNLSETAKQAILEPNHRISVNIVSVWELAVKMNIGKLKFSGGVAGFLALLDSNGFQILNMMPKHLLALEQLPLHHRDPFVRFLIAVAMSEGMEFITADEEMPQYAIPCVW